MTDDEKIIRQFFADGADSNRARKALDRIMAALAVNNQEAWVAALLNAPNPEQALAATPAVGGEAPEWIWFGEDENGGPIVTFGRWPKNGAKWRYKLAEIQPTEHDHPELPKRPFAFAVLRAPENGPDRWRLFMDEGEAREAAEQLDGDYEGLYRVGDRRSALYAAQPASPLRGRESWQEISTASAVIQDTAKIRSREHPRGDVIQLGGSLEDGRPFVFGHDALTHQVIAWFILPRFTSIAAAPPEQPAALPLAVRLRDEAGPPLPQMVAQRRAQLSQEQPAAPAKSSSGDKETP